MGEKIYTQLKEIFEMVEDRLLDAQKFDEGNSAAGTRVTKTLSDVQKKAKVLRLDVFRARKIQ
jgi:hypothetical protein